MASMAMMPVCRGSWTGLRGWAAPHARRAELHRAAALGRDGALAVDGLAERVHDATEESGAGRHLDDPAGAAHGVVLLDELGLAHQYRAHLVLVEVERHAHHDMPAFAHELQQLAGHGVLEAVDAGDAVTELDDGPDLADVDGGLVGAELSVERLLYR
jgi:hypothetical protein